MPRQITLVDLRITSFTISFVQDVSAVQIEQLATVQMSQDGDAQQVAVPPTLNDSIKHKLLKSYALPNAFSFGSLPALKQPEQDTKRRTSTKQAAPPTAIVRVAYQLLDAEQNVIVTDEAWYYENLDEQPPLDQNAIDAGLVQRRTDNLFQLPTRMADGLRAMADHIETNLENRMLDE